MHDQTINPQIQITVYETQLRKRMLGLYEGLDTQFGEPLRQVFLHFRVTLCLIADSRGNGEIGRGQLATLGLVHRAHELFLGCLSAIAEGNRQAFVACFRGLLETYGAGAWAREKSGRLPALLAADGPPIGRLMNVAYKTPGVKDDYKQASSFVHPAASSLFSGHRIINREDRAVLMSCPSPPFEEEEVLMHLRGVLAATWRIFECIRALLNEQLVDDETGAPVMQISLRDFSCSSGSDHTHSGTQDDD